MPGIGGGITRARSSISSKSALPDSDRSANPDRAQIAARDPRPDGLRMDPQTLRHIADRQELVVRRHWCVAATCRVVIRLRRHRRNGRAM